MADSTAMEIPDVLRGRIEKLEGGEAALAAISERDVIRALEILRSTNRERFTEGGPSASDDVSTEVFGVCRELRSLFPFNGWFRC